MTSVNLKGLGVALITPFDNHGNVDYTSLKRVLEHLVPFVDYIVVFGTTGESVTLSKEEKSELLQFIKQHTSGTPLVYGYGGNNTAQLLKDISTVNWDGISAVLSVSPYYNKPSQSGIIKHYQALANALPRPVILYNVPGRTGSNLSADTQVTLAKHDNIIGTKEASGNLDQISRVIEGSPEDFLVISGDDMLTPEILKLGGDGLISVLANAYPKEFKQGIEAHFEDKHELCSEIYGKFQQLNPLMYQEGSPTGIKELMSQLGLCKTHVRLPMDEASESLSNLIEENLF